MTPQPTCEPPTAHYAPDGICVSCPSCGYCGVIRLPFSASETAKLLSAHVSAHVAYAAFFLRKVIQ